MLMDSEMQKCKTLATKALQNLNFDNLRLEFPIRCKLMEYKNISLVLDVGANMGQYVGSLRQQGYRGKILSFEPLAEEFVKLEKNTSKDPDWDCKQMALGSYNGLCEMNRAGNSYSSSILPMLDRHVSNAPDSAYVGKEMVSIARLDSLGQESIGEKDRIYLKIDTQGYEWEVLKGAERMLHKVEAIELELSVVPLYERQVLYQQLIQYMNIMGFDLIWMEKGFSDQTTGEVLQFDGIFLRR